MDVYQLRLQLFLGRGSKGADSDVEYSAGILTEPGNRIGGGDRLPRLAHSAGTAVPVAEVVVRDPALRRGGIAAPHSPARATGAAVRRVGAERRPFRAGRAGAAELSLFPTQ